MKYLGIDYGEKRVGIAVSDETNKYAFPKVVLRNSSKIYSEIKRECDEEGIGHIVLGESKNFKGEENLIMKQIHIFKQNLERETGLKVIFHPEFMSSAQAERIQGGGKNLDSSAAAIILQDYLDHYKNKSK
ncbi:MAG: Holliday junction resolvase RuvX [Candidatus Paceibacterota bacterium]